MNIFNKVALQGLIKNRTRTVVTIIGVALGPLHRRGHLCRISAGLYGPGSGR